MGRPVEAWRGAFGDSYLDRNQATEEAVRLRARMWARVFERMPKDQVTSILEVGCNLGLNLRALPSISAATLNAVEPNARARRKLIEEGVLAPTRIVDASADALPFADDSFDLVFTSGVLIHVPPSELPRATDEIHRVARRFIVCIEYFAAEPEERVYRGEQGLLFKRDFGGYYMDRFADLKLIDHGFFWRRATGLDDDVWQVFEKT